MESERGGIVVHWSSADEGAGDLNGTPAPQESWSREELHAMSDEDRHAAYAAIARHRAREYDAKYGADGRDRISRIKGTIPTITRVVSTPESRAARELDDGERRAGR